MTCFAVVWTTSALAEWRQLSICFSFYVETAHIKLHPGLTVRARVYVLWTQRLGIVGKLWHKRESSFSDDVVFVKAFQIFARSLEKKIKRLKSYLLWDNHAGAKIQFVTQGTYSSERVETQHGNKPIKKADKGSTTVILNVPDKLQEGLVQLNNRDHYLPLEKTNGYGNTAESKRDHFSAWYICMYIYTAQSFPAFELQTLSQDILSFDPFLSVPQTP